METQRQVIMIVKKKKPEQGEQSVAVQEQKMLILKTEHQE
jgi:hypothetical protein